MEGARDKSSAETEKNPTLGASPVYRGTTGSHGDTAGATKEIEAYWRRDATVAGGSERAAPVLTRARRGQRGS